ncbi:intradiol ring-cleavage dioxygenase [Sphingobium sp.]|uniref:intradiol ring-cleavage dioxygenase n=1 Tax=Sphingobium sp. TaxID=1912891 RepID=UPI0028BE5716|nr:intradiol ring-cleavage dioxygenase [Sphingobium sp.]
MTDMTHGLNRRAMLTGIGAGSAAATAVMLAAAPRAATAASVPGEDVCRITPDVVDGPYYVDEQIVRRDITEGRQGIPLEMRVRVVDASCRPVADARVDCWQADALGIYSNFPNQGDDLKVATPGQTFLRGTQMTDADGWVVFSSIFPGWYRGRTTHVHFKIYIGGRTRLTAQMFFPDAINEYVYTHVPGYTRAAVRDTINVTDWIMEAGSRAMVAQVKEELDRYVATITYGVDPRATPAAAEQMPCPPAPALCVPEPGAPPTGTDRIASLVPSKAALDRPKAQKPPLPEGWKSSARRAGNRG